MTREAGLSIVSGTMSHVTNTTQEKRQLLESAAVGRILGITGDGVRALVRRGRLRPAIVTSRGWGLHRRSDIERYLRERGDRLHGQRNKQNA
jgi:hypothetical protein